MPDHEFDWPPDPTMRFGRCEMVLLDGRVIDLSGKTVGEVIAFVNAHGITPMDVLETRHYIAPGVLRARATFHLGRATVHRIGCVCAECETQRVRDAEDPRDR